MSKKTSASSKNKKAPAKKTTKKIVAKKAATPKKVVKVVVKAKSAKKATSKAKVIAKKIVKPLKKIVSTAKKVAPKKAIKPIKKAIAKKVVSKKITKPAKKIVAKKIAPKKVVAKQIIKSSPKKAIVKSTVKTKPTIVVKTVIAKVIKPIVIKEVKVKVEKPIKVKAPKPEKIKKVKPVAIKKPLIAPTTFRKVDNTPSKFIKEPSGKFEMEFVIRASEDMVFEFVSTESGLSEWFCDDVMIRDGVFTFDWDGQVQQAKLIKEVPPTFIRYQWVDKNDGSYFEFRTQKDELTNDISLIITDFADSKADEISARLLWESQIDKLLHVLGSFF
jgi:uncharacterized protein YndB with AHSA1/START domain